MPLPPSATLFPYTTLFRSAAVALGGDVLADGLDRLAGDDLAADGGLQGDLEEVSVDLLLEAYEELARSEEHTSELQSPCNLVCRLLLEKKKATHADTKAWE